MTRPRDVGTVDAQSPEYIRDHAPDSSLVTMAGVALNPHERSLLAFAFEAGGDIVTAEALDLCGDWRDPETAERATHLLGVLVRRGLLGKVADATFRLTNPTGQRVAAACAQQPEGE